MLGETLAKNSLFARQGTYNYVPFSEILMSSALSVFTPDNDNNDDNIYTG